MYDGVSFFEHVETHLTTNTWMHNHCVLMSGHHKLHTKAINLYSGEPQSSDPFVDRTKKLT